MYFGAADNITRDEAVIIFMNVFEAEPLDGVSENSTSTKFTDVTGRYVETVNFPIKRFVFQGELEKRAALFNRSFFCLRFKLCVKYDRYAP
ncbi:hypothetical protein M3221_19390 [Domibacillus indicus]|uniref:hypothetical protein n=1 Tax=Domibacillus indicus TaxID=1437523 RepID=UPI00203EAE3D|nr:hypothetical protein [Domibacillus indicus]MCM3790532.1 hypothetical protein [Domibacillus indicus]